MPRGLSTRGSGPEGRPAAHPEAEAPGQSSRVRIGAVLLGLLLVPLNAYWVVLSELRWTTILTLNPLFVPPLFCLAVLIGLNAACSRLCGRPALRRGEIIVIYVMLVMTCTVVSHDYLLNLMAIVPWPGWAATPENGWAATLHPHLPKWLFVWDAEVLRGAFVGDGRVSPGRIAQAWAGPLSLWALFILASGWMMLCLSVLLRRAWTDHTKLAFPIVRLPLAMTEDDPSLAPWRSVRFWGGFAVAMALGVTNGLAEWFPLLPHLPVRALWLTFPTQPWATISPFPLSFYPFIIGLAYFVPLDVSFSLWFFFLFFRAEMVAGWRYGQGGIYDFSLVSQQATAAWLVFGILLVYQSRRHLSEVLRSALGRGARRDADEPMSYRVAFWGLVAGAAVFCGFWISAGMSAGWVLFVLVSYLLVALGFTRIRAEAGSVQETWDVEVMRVFRFMDSRTVGPANLTAGSLQHWFWRMGRTHFMPNQLEGLKLAQERNVSLRSMTAPMLGALALAVVSGMASVLHVCYTDGAQAKCQGFPTWTAFETFSSLDSLLTVGRSASAGWYLPFGFAIGFMLLLSWLRARYIWFPLHPFGYCLGPLMHLYWFPFFISWLIKLLVLRHGGTRTYHALIPCALGLILGDYVNGAAWSLIGIIWRVPVYGIFH